MTHQTPLPSPFPGPTTSSVLLISAQSVRSTAKQLLEEHLWPAPLYYGSRTLKCVRACLPWMMRGAAAVALFYLVLEFLRRRKLRERQKNVERSYLLFGSYVRFGLDIGGTLCKVVYFEPHETSTPAQSALRARVSAFIRRSHSYGVTGRRDSALEVSLPAIRGTLHFLKFQTSMMPNFITIVKENELLPSRETLPGHEEGEEFLNSRSNSTENLESLEQQELHAAQLRMNRSYSAAWRSEEHRAQYNTSSVISPDSSSSISSMSSPEDNPPAERPPINALNEVSPGAPEDTTERVNKSPTLSVTTVPIPASTPLASAATPSFSSSNPSTPSSPHLAPASTAPSQQPQHQHHHHHHRSSEGRFGEVKPAAANYTAPGVAENAPYMPNEHVNHRSNFRSLTSPYHDSHSAAQMSSDAAAAAARHSSSSMAPPFAGGALLPVPPVPVYSVSANAASTASANGGDSKSRSNSTSSRDASGTKFYRPNNYISRNPFTAAPKRVVHPSPPSTTPPAVCATGGGAFKFEKLFQEQLHISLHKEDELRALVKGIDFMIHSCQDECYYLSHYRFREPLQKMQYASKEISYPYLVVNIGSGVSILKVTGPSSFERVGGTSLGGGTFFGLCRALTGCTSFEESLALAERGRFGMADLLVGDIYGGDYDEIGLAADTVAASFGKLVRGDVLKDVRKEDLAKAALVMITNNIGSIANLYARKVLNVPQMIFVGNFLNENDIAKRGLAFATEYWSNGAAKALFLQHEGYFGAVGSLLGENYHETEKRK